MLNISQYLDNWYDFYYEKNNNFDPKIEILVQDYALNKKKYDLEILIKKNNLQNKYVGICICDFKKSELDIIENIINKYNGIFKINLGEELGSEIHKYEDNVILACFPTPILGYNCLFDVINLNL